jgi:hypothetical protein
MPRYRVNFLKTVCNDRGDERRIRQRTLDLDSVGKEEAIEFAKQLFCSREKVSDWSLRCDSYEIEQLDPVPRRRRYMQRVAGVA